MASRSVNKVILLGRLGKDAESKFTTGGTCVATFSIATSWRQKDSQTGEWKDHTDWHNIVMWRAENVAQYLVKGTQVYIDGRLQTRSYENKEGRKVYVTEVVANEVILLGGKQNGEAGGDQLVSQPRSSFGQPAPPVGGTGGQQYDDSIPDDCPF